MKHEKRLGAGEAWDIDAHGQYFGYVSGAGEIEITVNGEVHYLSVNGVYQSFDGFQKVRVKNMSASVGDFVIEAGMGSIVLSQDGQLVEISKIRETVKTEILNESLNVSGSVVVTELPQIKAEIVGSVDVSGSHVVVDELPQVQAEIVNAVNVSGSHVVVDELPQVQAEIVNAVDVSGSHVVVDALPVVDVSGSRVIIESMPTVDAQFTAAEVSNALTTSYELGANSSVTIPARSGRKRLVIQAYVDSENTAICRVSDSSKTQPDGQFIFVGGGLMAELEHKHSDALKVWNPTDLNGITLVILEEF